MKRVGAILREAILRDTTSAEELEEAIARVQDTNEATTIPEYTEVPGSKEIEAIGDSKIEFLQRGSSRRWRA